MKTSLRSHQGGTAQLQGEPSQQTQSPPPSRHLNGQYLSDSPSISSSPQSQTQSDFASSLLCTTTDGQSGSSRQQTLSLNLAPSQSQTYRAQINYHSALDTLRVDYLKALLSRHESHVLAVSAWRRKRALKRAKSLGVHSHCEAFKISTLKCEMPLYSQNHKRMQQKHSIEVGKDSRKSTRNESSRHYIFGTTKSTCNMGNSTNNSDLEPPHDVIQESEADRSLVGYNSQAMQGPGYRLVSSDFVWQCRDFLARLGHSTSTPDMSKKERQEYLRQKTKIDERFGREIQTGAMPIWCGSGRDDQDTNL